MVHRFNNLSWQLKIKIYEASSLHRETQKFANIWKTLNHDENNIFLYSAWLGSQNNAGKIIQK